MLNEQFVPDWGSAASFVRRPNVIIYQHNYIQGAPSVNVSFHT